MPATVTVMVCGYWVGWTYLEGGDGWGVFLAEQPQASLCGEIIGSYPISEVGTEVLTLFLDPEGVASFCFPLDSTFPPLSPGLHRDSLSTSFGDSMTASGRGTSGMTHSLVPGEVGKLWLSGSPGSLGEDSHAP